MELPEVVPISDMRLRQKELLERASYKPIVLTQHGRAVAVLLTPESYNGLIEQIDDLQLAIEAIEARAEKGPVIDFDEYLTERGEDEHVSAPFAK